MNKVQASGKIGRSRTKGMNRNRLMKEDLKNKLEKSPSPFRERVGVRANMKTKLD
jgi:hypothetical protein